MAALPSNASTSLWAHTPTGLFLEFSPKKSSLLMYRVRRVLSVYLTRTIVGIFALMEGCGDNRCIGGN